METTIFGINEEITLRIAIAILVICLATLALLVRIKMKKIRIIKKKYNESRKNYNRMENTYIDIIELKENELKKQRLPKKITARELK